MKSALLAIALLLALIPSANAQIFGRRIAVIPQYVPQTYYVPRTYYVFPQPYCQPTVVLPNYYNPFPYQYNYYQYNYLPGYYPY